MKQLSFLFYALITFSAQAQLPTGYFGRYEFTDGSMENNSSFITNTLTGSMTSISDRNGISNYAADVTQKMNGVNLGPNNVTNTTLSFWMKSSAITTMQRLVQIYGSGGNGYRVEMDGSNIRVNARVESGPNYLGKIFPSPQDIDDNTWHHIAVRTKVSSTNQTEEFTLFVDGQSVLLNGNATGLISPGGSITTFLTNATFIIDPLDGQYTGDIDDIYLYKSALTDNEISDIYNYSVPEPLSRVYVDISATGAGNGSDWENAFTSLNEAIEYTLEGGEIWVAEGLYLPTVNERTFTYAWDMDSIKLYGGFAGDETQLSERDWRENQTIFSGDIGIPNDNNDNLYTVLTGPAGTATKPINYALIDGITLQDGLANGGTYVNLITGGGFYSYDYVKHTEIKNCTFKNNESSNGAAVAIYANFVNKILDFENCIFNDNTSTHLGSAMTVRSKNNKSITANITNCLFTNNANLAQASSSQYSTLFYFGAAGTNSTFNINITNSTITKNTNFYNGTEDIGLFSLNASSTTLDARVHLKNNIIWNNGGNDILYKKYSSGHIFNTLTQENSINDLNNLHGTNTNVLVSDPEFTDDANSDYTLKSTSPALDQGVSTGLNLPSHDLNGESRISGSNIDLGCYEFQSTVGVNDHEFTNSLIESTYPNPTIGLVTFTINEQIENIEIYNATGQLVLSKSNSNTIDLSQLNDGMYLVQVQTLNKNGLIKLIKN